MKVATLVKNIYDILLLYNFPLCDVLLRPTKDRQPFSVGDFWVGLKRKFNGNGNLPKKIIAVII